MGGREGDALRSGGLIARPTRAPLDRLSRARRSLRPAARRARPLGTRARPDEHEARAFKGGALNLNSCYIDHFCCSRLFPFGFTV